MHKLQNRVENRVQNIPRADRIARTNRHFIPGLHRPHLEAQRALLNLIYAVARFEWRHRNIGIDRGKRVDKTDAKVRRARARIILKARKFPTYCVDKRPASFEAKTDLCERISHHDLTRFVSEM